MMRSASSLRPLSTITGTAVSARTCRSTSRPRTFGRPRSSTTSSGASSAILSSAVAPSLASSTANPSRSRAVRTTSTRSSVVVDDEDRHAAQRLGGDRHDEPGCAPAVFTERLNQTTEMVTATTVSAAWVSDFVTTNVPTDWVNCSHTATDALTRHVTAHRSEIPRKQRRTRASAITCGGIGQKSAAIRCANGPPERHREEEGHRDQRGAERRLEEVEHRAAGGEGEDRPGGQRRPCR